jgi:hypothetical protein
LREKEKKAQQTLEAVRARKEQTLKKRADQVMFRLQAIKVMQALNEEEARKKTMDWVMADKTGDKPYVALFDEFASFIFSIHLVIW